MTLALRNTRRLADLEAVIERGLGTFVEVGEALEEIRGSRLYRETHPTFEAYCRDRWGFTRQHAARLMDAAEVAHVLPELSPIGVNEAQARELAPLLRTEGPGAVVEAWAEANGRTNGKPTARVIREVVAQVIEVEGPPIAVPDSRFWQALVNVMDEIEALPSDAASIAATVPSHRRAATARRLRKLGTELGRIAWSLEGQEVVS
jgi:hypothetical protein